MRLLDRIGRRWRGLSFYRGRTAKGWFDRFRDMRSLAFRQDRELEQFRADGGETYWEGRYNILERDSRLIINQLEREVKVLQAEVVLLRGETVLGMVTRIPRRMIAKDIGAAVE